MPLPGAPATGAFAPLDVMVKFRVGSEMEAARAAAVRTDPPDLAKLAPAARLLSDKTATPLAAKQLLSGGWVLFAIAIEEVTNRAAALLGSAPGVVRVNPVARETGIGMSPVTDLAVDFRPESEQAILLAQQLSGTSATALSRVLGDLAKRLDLPVEAARVEKPTHLIIRIDLPELTQRTVQRLLSLTEIVESAQLNFTTTIMRKSGD